MNITKIRPSDVAKLLNTNNQDGSSDIIYRHFRAAGARIAGDAQLEFIDLFKYVAWLSDTVHSAPDATQTSARTYEQRKDAERQRQAEQSQSGRNIGDLPAVANLQRKEACRFNLKLYCEIYHPEVFDMEWSQDHLKVIAKIENAVLHGDLFALAMPRGSGKTSLCEAAAEWAMLYGHCCFILIVGSNQKKAEDILDSIKIEFEVNDLLEADFPEVIFPIRCLDGIANRCAGQLYKGERTRITWTSDQIVLPTIEGSAASGVIVSVAGITGSIRGLKHKRADGKSVRPDFVILDDPQTFESAHSLEQTKTRMKILAGDILGLAGPRKSITGIMPCTVIQPGDMADQILDKSKHPEWKGERTKMLYESPKNKALWDKYAELRAESLRINDNISEATAFYVANKTAMDEGAIVAWDKRFKPENGEVSAIQHAMNLKFQDEAVFMAEYQNDPLPETADLDSALLSVDAIASKLNGLPRRVVPLECEHVTMFIDVQKTLLFYVVVAWAENFTGAVLDYGAWPEQPDNNFAMAKVKKTIQSELPECTGLEGQLFLALTKLTEDKLQREFTREDGTAMRISRCMIDANWGASTDVVYQFCRQTQFASMIYPSHGIGISASQKPMTEYRRQKGDRLGFNWIIPSTIGKKACRHVNYDTNFWKSFIHSRLATSIGEKGCLSLYGRRPQDHLTFAEHLTAEYRVKTAGRGRTIDEWKQKPDRPDNHWFDCIVGSAVGASIQGAKLVETSGAVVKRERISLAELQKAKRKNQ